jgi:hypothetical protein
MSVISPIALLLGEGLRGRKREEAQRRRMAQTEDERSRASFVLFLRFDSGDTEVTNFKVPTVILGRAVNEIIDFYVL